MQASTGAPPVTSSSLQQSHGVFTGGNAPINAAPNQQQIHPGLDAYSLPAVLPPGQVAPGGPANIAPYGLHEVVAMPGTLPQQPASAKGLIEYAVQAATASSLFSHQPAAPGEPMRMHANVMWPDGTGAAGELMVTVHMGEQGRPSVTAAAFRNLQTGQIVKACLVATLRSDMLPGNVLAYLHRYTAGQVLLTSQFANGLITALHDGTVMRLTGSRPEAPLFVADLHGGDAAAGQARLTIVVDDTGQLRVAGMVLWDMIAMRSNTSAYLSNELHLNALAPGWADRLAISVDSSPPEQQPAMRVLHAALLQGTKWSGQALPGGRPVGFGAAIHEPGGHQWNAVLSAILEADSTLALACAAVHNPATGQKARVFLGERLQVSMLTPDSLQKLQHVSRAASADNFLWAALHQSVCAGTMAATAASTSSSPQFACEIQSIDGSIWHTTLSASVTDSAQLELAGAVFQKTEFPADTKRAFLAERLDPAAIDPESAAQLRNCCEPSTSLSWESTALQALGTAVRFAELTRAPNLDDSATLRFAHTGGQWNIVVSAAVDDNARLKLLAAVVRGSQDDSAGRHTVLIDSRLRLAAIMPESLRRVGSLQQNPQAEGLFVNGLTRALSEDAFVLKMRLADGTYELEARSAAPLEGKFIAKARINDNALVRLAEVDFLNPIPLLRDPTA